MHEGAKGDSKMESGDLVSCLNELIEGERAGVKVATAYRDGLSGEAARRFLDRVRVDEARSCALLVRAVERLGGEPSHATGRFLERALVVAGEAERLAFLNRGQRWVLRRLEAILSRIVDPDVAAWLREVRDLHVRNVLACEELEACDD